MNCVFACMLCLTQLGDPSRNPPAAHWPQWRGPLATGAALVGDPPTRWDEKTNVKWKVAVPGKGQLEAPFIHVEEIRERRALKPRVPVSTPHLEITLEIEKRQAPVNILLGDRYNEPQVSVDHSCFGVIELCLQQLERLPELHELL